MEPRLHPALARLCSQLNARYPKRKKPDGWIEYGIVHAIDVAHDPDHGLDGAELAETLRLSRDSRIKYVIFDGRIFSSMVRPWVWRPYTGLNRHSHHVHISVIDTNDWTMP